MYTIDEAAVALSDGVTTSRELVETSLERIGDPSGQGAKTFLKIYHDQARAMADAADTLRRAGREPSRYAGIPISIKDLFDVAGETTTAGSTVLMNAPPALANAVVVHRLFAAGLIPVGRTNMTEFAFSGVGINPHFGTPLSPWDRTTGHIPGGSSSGAAVSVVDGFAFAGIGTDTGGSCRIPAALCGIVGFKPTARRVPLTGVLPLAPSLDSVGPLARSVACCAVIDAIMAGELDSYRPRSGTADWRSAAGLRLVLPTNLAFANIDDPTEASLDRAVARLDAAGVLIDRRPLASIDAISEAQAQGGFAAVEAYAWHKTMLNSAAEAYDPRVASRIELGARMSAADYFMLVQTRAKIVAQFETEIKDYHAVIMPTVPIAPPPLAAFAEDDNYKRLNYLLLRNPSTFNFLDACAISVPCNVAGSPPAGLMIAAPCLHDAKLLAIAAAIEATLLRC